MPPTPCPRLKDGKLNLRHSKSVGVIRTTAKCSISLIVVHKKETILAQSKSHDKSSNMSEKDLPTLAVCAQWSEEVCLKSLESQFVASPHWSQIVYVRHRGWTKVDSDLVWQ